MATTDSTPTPQQQFQQSLRKIIGYWPSGAERYEGQRANLYNQQKLITDTSSGDVKMTVPTDPTSDPNFYDNYRSATKSLAFTASAKKSNTNPLGLPSVDKETQSIMDRIKLPSYQDILNDEKRAQYTEASKQNSAKAMASYLNDATDFEKENFYYKLRAAQVLKGQSKETREAYLNNFNTDAYNAKNQLDSLIANQNQKDTEAYKKLGSAIKQVAGSFNEKLKDAMLRATGQRVTDENGVTTTTTYSSGPANLDELAERLGENNSFKAGNGFTYINPDGSISDTPRVPTEEEQKKVAEKANAAENSEKANAAENSENEDAASEETTSEDIVTYTYKPGDTFGQVIKDLGLTTDKGLWGPDGDVEYYTKQLVEQGALDSRGNVKLGIPIKLRRRK